MNDLEICKRVSEIGLTEKYPKCSIEFDEQQNCFWVADNFMFSSWPLLKPLEDDGLCFRLMLKYKIVLEFSHKDEYGVKFYEATINESWGFAQVFSEDPRKAVALAIIELKKGE
jgi:hypothetical protein